MIMKDGFVYHFIFSNFIIEQASSGSCDITCCHNISITLPKFYVASYTANVQPAHESFVKITR